nr:MAG TPA: hypothetical protein [Caudoviricetes sp.]
MAGTLSSRQLLKLPVPSPRPGSPPGSTTPSSGVLLSDSQPRPLSTVRSQRSGAGGFPARWPCP